jgi:hypothetical protein
MIAESHQEMLHRQERERFAYQQRQTAHTRALEAQNVARSRLEQFIARQNCDRIHIKGANGCFGEWLYENGARLIDSGAMVEPPTDSRERLLLRRMFLKVRLKAWTRQYTEQCSYVCDQLATASMGAGPLPAGNWREELPAFAKRIEDIHRQLATINHELFPPCANPIPDTRTILRQQAAADTVLLAGLPQF